MPPLSLSENLCEFAAEVYDFCPDTVDQSVGLIDTVAEAEILAAAEQLCPELSLDVRQRLSDKEAEMESVMADASEPLQAVFEIAKQLDHPTMEQGIKLLALSIFRLKTLYLWWD